MGKIDPTGTSARIREAARQEQLKQQRKGRAWANSVRRNARSTPGAMQGLVTARYNQVHSQVKILNPNHQSMRDATRPPSMTAVRSMQATRDSILSGWAQRAQRADRNHFTKVGRSFQKHFDRGEYILSGPKTASNFNRNGGTLLRSIVSHPGVSISVTPNSNLVRVTAPNVGAARFYRNGGFHSFDGN